jgi:hypothetical protein
MQSRKNRNVHKVPAPRNICPEPANGQTIRANVQSDRKKPAMKPISHIPRRVS